jgi:CRP-like cAMP-binding protein
LGSDDLAAAGDAAAGRAPLAVECGAAAGRQPGPAARPARRVADAQAARLLAEEAEDGRVALPQRTLAAMLGVQRPPLNKASKDLERDGIIKISYSAIDILDQGRLTLLAR